MKVGTMAHKYIQAKECRFGLRCTCGTQPVSHIHLIHKTVGQWGPVFLCNLFLGVVQTLGHIFITFTGTESSNIPYQRLIAMT